jgi:hypothetical protein
MLDIVTVVFEPEIEMLRAQAHSISRFCHDINRIVIVVNDDASVMSQIDTAWWAQYQSQVTVLHRSRWFDQFELSGWVSQQVLKILASAESNMTWNWVLDAKTLVVRDFDPSQYQDNQGRIHTKHQQLLPVFDASKQIIDQLLGIDFARVAGPGGIPHWLNSQACRDIIHHVPQTTGSSLIDFWQQNGCLTEFMLHSAWLEFQGGLDLWYTNRQDFSAVNISHCEVDQFDRKYQELQDPSTLTFGIHRDAVLSPSQQQLVQQYLKRRGLISHHHM